MESPGNLHFISSNKLKIAIAALIILAINGGGFKLDYGDMHIDLSTDGFIKNLSEYLDRKTDRETKESIKNALDSLEINTPKAFKDAAVELYKAQNNARNKY